MPRLVTWVELTFSDGDTVKVRTSPGDQVNAERALNGPANEHLMELQYRTDYTALRRTHPEHPAARNFRDFMDLLESRDELSPPDPEDDNMDPTRPADSAG